MKSVVVEASTVAKAIELAWQKAEKPEEFFIRILQEHTSGFLGFGAQKAKIVFFFKNSQKSDSLFPTVLKQKEYASLFHNDKLKAPSQLNVVDNELNKNVVLNQKKKQHPNKSTHHARQATPDAKPHPQAAPTKNLQQAKPQFNTIKTQVKIELPVKSVVKQEQPIKKEEMVKKPQVQTSKAPQAPKVAQASKVVAPQAPVAHKVEELVKQQVAVMKVTEEVVKSQPLVAPVATAPRVITKLKRRPLTGADQGVSGITRSSESLTGLAPNKSLGLTRLQTSSTVTPSITKVSTPSLEVAMSAAADTKTSMDMMADLRISTDKKSSFDLSKPISELVNDSSDFDLDIVKKTQPSREASADTAVDKGDQE